MRGPEKPNDGAFLPGKCWSDMETHASIEERRLAAWAMTQQAYFSHRTWTRQLPGAEHLRKCNAGTVLDSLESLLSQPDQYYGLVDFFPRFTSS